MNCTRWREQASDYIEGTLPPDVAAAMRTHVASCAACRADEASLRVLTRELNVLPQLDPPMFFRENVRAAVERQSTRPILSGRGKQAAAGGSPWQRLFGPSGRLGQVAFGTALAGSAAAAALYLMIAPGKNGNAPLVADVAPRVSKLLPGAGEYSDSEAAERAPRLVMSRTQVELSGGDGPAYEFTFRLENAEHGTARFNLIGDKNVYRFPELSQDQPRTLQVPFAAADSQGTVSLFGGWTAGGASHSKYLFVPVPTSEAEKTFEEKQSFGLPQMTLAEAAREIAARYGRPVTLEDAPADMLVTLVARSETAAQVLRGHLAPYGLRVVSSPSGILVTPDARRLGPSPQATPAAGEPSPAVAR